MFKVEQIRSSQRKEYAIEQCDKAFQQPIMQRSNYRTLFDKIDANAVFIVAYDEDILGYAAMYCNDLETREAYITLIAVRPEYQGMHIGKNILSTCREIALKYGMTTIKLEVRKDNNKAIAFYLKNGFDYIEQRNEESIYMLKHL